MRSDERPNCMRRNLAICNLSFSISSALYCTESSATFSSLWQASAKACSSAGSVGSSAVATDMALFTKRKSSLTESIQNRRHVRPALVDSAAPLLLCGANPSPRPALPSAPASTSLRHRRSAAKRNAPSPAACNSSRNAAHSPELRQLVRVTHPFHTLSGREFVCVGERSNRSGKRLLLRAGNQAIGPIPPQWTDAGCPDPEVFIGQGRALFRLADLLELATLVSRMTLAATADAPARCKANSAASVKGMMPKTRTGRD